MKPSKNSACMIVLSLTCCGAQQAMANITIDGVEYSRSGSSETVVAVFSVPDGGTTVETYAGLVELVVSGVGQSFASYFNDAFYVYTDPNGPTHYGSFYQLTFDTEELLSCHPEHEAKHVIVYDIDAGYEVTPSYVPSYKADHQYNFVIDINTTTPSILHFGVSDCNFRDNPSWTYTIDVYQLEPSAIPDLDIKPGSCPNPVNVKSQGKLPVALMGADSFDVSLVDWAALELARADGVGGSVPPLNGPPGPGIVIEDVGPPFDGELCECEEHDGQGDNLLDLSLKFSTPELVEALELGDLTAGETIELVLSGTLVDGVPFTASDCILIVPRSDFDADNDVDLRDFGLFQRCFGGPGQEIWDGCEIVDIDEDGDVDISDFGRFQRCMSGPNHAVDPACDD